MARRLTPWLTALHKRWLAVVALLAYLAGAIGFPLPVPLRGVSTQSPTAKAVASSVPVLACGCPAEEREAGKCCCCSAHADEHSGGGCCGQPAARSESDDETAPATAVVWAAGLWSWRCQGLNALGEAPVTLQAATFSWKPSTLPPTWISLSTHSPLTLVLSVPEPPPRTVDAIV
jgi:hypothetical protein